MNYGDVENVIQNLKLQKLKAIQLFDIFEGEKLGIDRKSLAITFTFQDDEKTLTDNEIDSMMNKLMQVLGKELNAEVRKN